MGKYRRIAPVAKLDLCKINTAKLRKLPAKDLDRVQGRIGRLYELPKKPDKRFKKIHFLLSRFLVELQNSRTDYNPRFEEWLRRQPDYDPKNRARWRDSYMNEAKRTERQIWDAQAKAGCKIPGHELVARDAEREDKPDVATKIRADARRPPTPHRRPAKIR